jgi:hypothetical protein
MDLHELAAPFLPIWGLVVALISWLLLQPYVCVISA